MLPARRGDRPQMMAALEKLRGRSLEELRVRAMQMVLSRIERLQLATMPACSLGTPLFASKKAVADVSLFQSLDSSSESPQWIAKQIAARDPNAMLAHRQAFDAMLQGRVALLGHGELFVGDPPDWHREAVGGQVAPFTHWSKIPYLDANVVGDHKILWEINRHQYLLAPAMCWLSNADPRSFALVQRHVSSWLDRNPPRVGVNWVSSLEVAYRAITWCWLLWLLRDAPWDAKLRQRMAASLENHASHIERYLSTYFSPNTHLTGEALGLFFVGSVLKDSRHAQRWQRAGSDILESWLDKQVYDDGVYFEQASQYQRYTAEIYLQFWRLADSTAWPLSSRVRSGMGRLFDVLRSIVAGNGRMPLIGDDDGGSLMPVDLRPPDDLRGVLLAGATSLGRPDLIVPGDVHPALSYWLCGVAATEQILASDCKVPAWRNMYFANGGTAVLRDDWSTDSALAVIDAGRHGVFNCGHAHADALSCTLSLGKTDLFIDRGTFTYVGNNRNEFRGTGSHNTLEFDGAPSVMPQGPFQWGPVPNRPKAALRCNESISVFESIADGHAGTPRPSRHQRIVMHNNNGAWVIFDAGRRIDTQSATVRWQLAPRLTACAHGSGVFDISDSSSQPVARIAAPLGPRFTLSARDVSLRYGSISPASMLEAAADQQLRVLTIVLPAHASDELPEFRDVAFAGGIFWTWDDDSGTHRIMVSSAITEAIPNTVGWQLDADLVWLSQLTGLANGEPFTPDRLVAINPRALTAPGGEPCMAEIVVEMAGVVVLGRLPQGWANIALNEPVRGLESK